MNGHRFYHDIFPVKCFTGELLHQGYGDAYLLVWNVPELKMHLLRNPFFVFDIKH